MPRRSGARIESLTRGQAAISPRFLRFAIERALEGAAGASAVDLVLRYVDALHGGRLNINADDLLRAAAIAATEALRHSLAPREIEPDYLRGVLVAERMSFLDARNVKDVDPAELLELLVRCGLLKRNVGNRRLQFVYDPVAEYLAAWRVARARDDTGLSQLKERIRAARDSPLARALLEVEASLEAAA